MKKASKGVIDVSTCKSITIKKSAPFDEFKVEIIKADLENAAETSNFIGKDGKNIIFEFANQESSTSTGKEQRSISFMMTNFEGVNFADSFKTAPEEKQIAFKAWSKFWSHLSKLGYNIK